MRTESERYISIHIPKAGGTSLKSFFQECYGSDNVYLYNHMTSEIYPSDQEEGIKNPYLLSARNLITRHPSGELFYSLVANYIKNNYLHRNVERSSYNGTAELHIPDSFCVIHGHFTTSKLKVEGAYYVTVLREPFERALSHYNYYHWLFKSGFLNHLPEWFKPGMSFEEFYHQKEIVNLQSRFVGDVPLAKFKHIGVTNKLSDYVRKFDPTGKVQLRRENRARPVSAPQISEEEKFLFMRLNQQDYELYEEALSLIDSRSNQQSSLALVAI